MMWSSDSPVKSIEIERNDRVQILLSFKLTFFSGITVSESNPSMLERRFVFRHFPHPSQFEASEGLLGLDFRTTFWGAGRFNSTANIEGQSGRQSGRGTGKEMNKKEEKIARESFEKLSDGKESCFLIFFPSLYRGTWCTMANTIISAKYNRIFLRFGLSFLQYKKNYGSENPFKVRAIILLSLTRPSDDPHTVQGSSI